MTYSPSREQAETRCLEAQAESALRVAAAAEKAADAFARLVDIIGRLPAPGQGMWKKG